MAACMSISKNVGGRKPYQPPFSGTQPSHLFWFASACGSSQDSAKSSQVKPGESLFASTQMQVMQQTS
jgi:hypothetical protein